MPISEKRGPTAFSTFPQGCVSQKNFKQYYPNKGIINFYGKVPMASTYKTTNECWLGNFWGVSYSSPAPQTARHSTHPRTSFSWALSSPLPDLDSGLASPSRSLFVFRIGLGRFGALKSETEQGVFHFQQDLWVRRVGWNFISGVFTPLCLTLDLVPLWGQSFGACPWKPKLSQAVK